MRGSLHQQEVPCPEPPQSRRYRASMTGPSRAVTYVEGANSITETMLSGFFVGWPRPPSAAQHLAVLRGSSHVVLAISGEEVVGFINALSDGLMAAFIPLLEVRPDHQGQGIGTELARHMLGLLWPLYSVDIVCDPKVAPFYERLGGQRLTGMAWRNREAAVVSNGP
jgi:GNAT superfamily N-acetyltransferase